MGVYPVFGAKKKNFLFIVDGQMVLEVVDKEMRKKVVVVAGLNNIVQKEKDLEGVGVEGGEGI